MKSLFLSKQSTILWCFSPAVMLGTFITEFILAAWVLSQYGRTAFGRLAGLTLFLLGIFQVTEYQICGRQPNEPWALVGFTAITLLPPLGIHLLSFFTHEKTSRTIGYWLAGILTVLGIYTSWGLGGATCNGNYIILNLTTNFSLLYGLYYFGYLLLGVWQAHRLWRESKQPLVKTTTLGMAVGYLAFMLPMAIVYITIPATRDAVPSIMCGFAVIFALILTVWVVPAATRSLKTVNPQS